MWNHLDMNTSPQNHFDQSIDSPNPPNNNQLRLSQKRPIIAYILITVAIAISTITIIMWRENQPSPTGSYNSIPEINSLNEVVMKYKDWHSFTFTSSIEVKEMGNKFNIDNYEQDRERQEEVNRIKNILRHNSRLNSSIQKDSSTSLNSTNIFTTPIISYTDQIISDYVFDYTIIDNQLYVRDFIDPPISELDNRWTVFDNTKPNNFNLAAETVTSLNCYQFDNWISLIEDLAKQNEVVQQQNVNGITTIMLVSSQQSSPQIDRLFQKHLIGDNKAHCGIQLMSIQDLEIILSLDSSQNIRQIHSQHTHESISGMYRIIFTLDVNDFNQETIIQPPMESFGASEQQDYSQILSRDTQRRADLYSLSNAIFEYKADTGNMPIANYSPIAIGTDPALINLHPILVPKYLNNIPHDPLNGSLANTNYTIFLNTNGQLVIEAISEIDPTQKIIVKR
jgi:hypothetical protein